MNDNNFTLLLKIIGFSILIGIVCYNWGRYSAKPEIRTETVTEKVYSLPACLEAVCRSLYPAPDCKAEVERAIENRKRS